MASARVLDVPAIGRLPLAVPPQHENAALDRRHEARNRAERLALSGQAQDVLARDVPQLPLWERKQVVAMRAGVDGVRATFDPSLRMRSEP